jgi:hypothetical protein
LVHPADPATSEVAPLTLHDGPASVASAFRLDELVSLAHAAGAREMVASGIDPGFGFQ